MTEYVHEVRVRLGPDGDPAALGGAVTTALCGHWQHDPPCRWPHESSVRVDGDLVVVTTTFTADPAEEQEVRRRLDEALAVGSLAGPDGRVSRWSVVPG